MTVKEWDKLRETMSNLDNLILFCRHSCRDDCSVEVAEALDEVWDIIDEIKTEEVSDDKRYEWKARGGSKGIVEADNLLDLIKQVNLGLMNELGYYLDEFTSIEEMETKTIKEKD